MTGQLRGPVPYFGSKQTLAPRIVELLPPHAHYVEPFAGGLSVLLAKRPSPHETVNDLDEDLVCFWRVLREQPDELHRVCAATPHSRAEFEDAQVRLASDLPDIERARCVWLLLTQGRSGRLVRSGWRHYIAPAGCRSGMPGYLDGYRDRVRPVAERLAGVTLECGPALDLIRDYGRAPEVLLYVDPPYLADVRGHADRAYQHEMRDEADHDELLDALLACRSAVVLSGYPSQLYDSRLADWHRVELRARTGNARQGEQERVEVLWSNNPLGRQEPLW